MTSEQQALLNELITVRDQAFSNGLPDVSKIQKINSRLKGIQPADRRLFKQFVTELKNRLFDIGANIPGLDLSYFEENTDHITSKEEMAVPVELVAKTAIEALAEIVDCIKEDLLTLKNYFFLQLHSVSNSNYEPIIIYEDGCFYQPVKKKFQEKYGACLCKTIKEMRQDIESNSFPDSSFIAIVIVSTKIDETKKIDERESDLKAIINHFEGANQLSPKKLDSIKATDVITTNDIDSLLDEIRYVTSAFLTNAELSNDEEKIIKKLFRDSNCPVLEYKVLKGGKSGSKVIEIRPKKNYATSQTKRFIIKFSPIDDKRKISIEAKRFGDHIEHFSVPNYQKTYEKNSTTEAIKYTYASGNSITTSYSFSEIVTDIDNEFHSEQQKIIDDIFSSDPFELWKQSSEEGRYKISELYSDYIKPEKFFENVKRIKGLNDAQLALESIVSDFNKIFDHEINTKIKVCHGDFHSENFFKDVNGTYLIDFGFTDKRHAIIDHTSLECSVKFKHVPFYIDSKLLEDIEGQLLSDDSFNATFEIQTKRKDILRYYDLIRTIRINSLPHLKNENSKLEYFISLFIITCRHAQYNDLNQLYALKSAEIIGKKIIPFL